MIFIDFDGKLEVIPFVEAGEGKWSSFVDPAGFIDGDFGGLAGNEVVVCRFFYVELSDVVCDVLSGKDFDDVLFHKCCC